MKLHKVHIQNYRCFESLEVELGQQCTVVIGKNGAGKSSLLSALRKGLSFMFARTEYYESNLHTSNTSTIRSFEFWDSRLDPIKRKFSYPIEVRMEGSFLNPNDLNWSLLKSSADGQFHPKRYIDAQDIVLQPYNENPKDSPLPLLAFFSDAYPHVLSDAGDIAKQIVQQSIFPRDFGYYGWDESTNCMDLWIKRLMKISRLVSNYHREIKYTEELMDIWVKSGAASSVSEFETYIETLNSIKNDKRFKEYQLEFDFIKNKILQVSQALNRDYNFINEDFQIANVRLDTPTLEGNDSIEFLFKDSRAIYYEMLPQGYKRILSIAIDLAYRSFILNKDAETSGVCFIDEIELHLHPSLQQEIIARLCRAFPNIQFIVTTHSPLVISNFNADGVQNKIIQLEQEGNSYSVKELENVYGLDYATNLAEVMGVAPRASTIDKYINAYLFLMGKGKKEKAEVMLGHLSEYLGGEIPPKLLEEIQSKAAQL